AVRQRDNCPRPQRQAYHHRRPIRRDPRAPRRLLSRGRKRSRRSDCAGRADSRGPHGRHRSPARSTDAGGRHDVSKDWVQREIVRVYRDDSRRILATLIRLLGDFDAAEEAMQDAFAVAVERWAQGGVPSNPRTWLISTGRFRAIDRLRREARREPLPRDAMANAIVQAPPAILDDDGGVEDDRLRLIFTCCHPALAREAQVALTLRTICGLTTEEIARAFLVPGPTMAQRL